MDENLILETIGAFALNYLILFLAGVMLGRGVKTNMMEENSKMYWLYLIVPIGLITTYATGQYISSGIAILTGCTFWFTFSREKLAVYEQSFVWQILKVLGFIMLVLISVALLVDRLSQIGVDFS